MVTVGPVVDGSRLLPGSTEEECCETLFCSAYECSSQGAWSVSRARGASI